MNLILEAIKSLFRKAEAGISTLSGRVTALENRVPKPSAKDRNKFLRGDGTWAGDVETITVQYTSKMVPAGDMLVPYKTITAPPGTYRTLKAAAISGEYVTLLAICDMNDSSNHRVGVDHVQYVYDYGSDEILVFGGYYCPEFWISPGDSTHR